MPNITEQLAAALRLIEEHSREGGMDSKWTNETARQALANYDAKVAATPTDRDNWDEGFYEQEPLRLSGQFVELDPSDLEGFPRLDPEADMPPAAHGCWEPDDEPPVRHLAATVVCVLLLVAVLGTMLWITRPSACMAMGLPAAYCVD